MEQFLDQNGCWVTFSTRENPFKIEARHVLVICTYKDGWVLTKHKKRGLEFPGGKIEANETIEGAAKREVFEETGGLVDSLQYIGCYLVEGSESSFVKMVYFAEIIDIREKDSYLETEGPVFMYELPENIESDERFSFIMKDRMVDICLELINKKRNSSL